MNIRKRAALCILMVISMLIGVVLPQDYVRADNNPSVNAYYSVSGDKVTITLEGNNFNDIMQFDFDVYYDGALLELVEHQKDYVTGLAEGVHTTFTEPVSGKASFSVFTNDGKLSFSKSKLLELTFQTCYEGTRSFYFAFKVRDCRRNGENGSVTVDCPSGLAVSDMTSNITESYDCGLTCLHSARVGAESEIGLWFYKTLTVTAGSFDLIYDPTQLQYSGNYASKVDGLDVSCTSETGGTIHVEFRTRSALSIKDGKLLEIGLVPVKKSTQATVSAGNFSLKDQFGRTFDAKVETSTWLQTESQDAVNIFELAASPSQWYAGQIYEVTLNISNNQGFHTLDGVLSYDAQLLEYVPDSAVWQGSLRNDGGILKQINNDASQGALQITLVSTAVQSANGAIVKVSFRVKSPARKYTYLRFAPKNEDGTFVYMPTSSNKEIALSYVGASMAIQLLGIKGVSDSTGGSGTGGSTGGNGGSTGGSTGNTGGTMGGSTGNTGDTTGGSSGGNATTTLASCKAASVSNTSKGILLKWNLVPNATGYIIWRRIGNGAYDQYKPVTNGSLSFEDTAVASGMQYSYRVEAFNGAVIGTSANELKQMYLAATMLSSIANQEKSIQIKWKAVAGAKQYVIYRKVGSGGYAKLATCSGTVYTDSKSLSNGKTYTYKVCALNGSYAGLAKNTAQILWLKRPSISSLASKKSGTLLVKCAKNKSAKKYQIQVSTAKNFKKNTKTVTVSSVKAVSKTIKGLKKNKKYYVRIRAYKGSSYSVWSAVKTKKTKK